MTHVEMVLGDITRQDVDAIVNAANSLLLGGGGMDGAIHSAAGPGLFDECVDLGGCPTGAAKMTGGYRLPARLSSTWSARCGEVAGAARPIFSRCYRSALELAAAHDLRSIAFPCISTGVFGYPKREAAGIAVRTVREVAPSGLELVRFVCYTAEDLEIYEELL